MGGRGRTLGLGLAPYALLDLVDRGVTRGMEA
jgi:hypothetical protein